MAARVYATRAELVDYAPADVDIPAEAEAERMLTRASEVVEELTMSAVYPVDSSGQPTEQLHIDALRKATCAQVVDWLDTGDELGTADRWGNVAAGSISLSRGSTGTARHRAGAPEPVTRPLRLAGLIPGTVHHG